MKEKANRIDPYKLLAGDSPDSTFFLRTGMEMPEFGIVAGDYIVVDRQAEAKDGKLVVATLDGELRVMRLIRDNGAFLEAADKRMEITGQKHVFIWCVIKWILRKA